MKKIQSLKNLNKYIIALFRKYLHSTFVVGSFYLIEINNKFISNAMYYMIYHVNLRFDLLIDITCIDITKRNIRDNYILYNYLSTIYKFRCFLGSSFLLFDVVDTLTWIFKSAEWYEREIYDMFGVRFANHPDLRRILCDYGFDGFPLRKDFPVTGYIEPYYSSSTNTIEFKPVHLTQEMRVFDLAGVWSQLYNKL